MKSIGREILNRKKCLVIFCALAVFVLCDIDVKAADANLVTYTFGTTTGTKTPTTTAAHITAINFDSSGSSGTFVAGNPSSGKAITNAGGWSVGSNYFGFSITPDSGYRVNVSSLRFDDNAYSSDGKGPTAWNIKYQVPGGSLTNGGTGSTHTAWGTNMTTGVSAIQNAAGTITIQISATGAKNNGNGYSWSLDNIMLTGDTQARASLLTSLADSPASRMMQNTADVRYTMNVKNDALTASTIATEGLNYTMGLSGTTGLSLSATSGPTLGDNLTASYYVNVDTSTTGTKGGGTVSTSSSNAWRANGTAGATSTSQALSSVAVVAKRTVTGDTLVLGGKYLSGARLDNLGSQTLTLRSTGADSSNTRVTAAGHTFNSTESFNTSATGSGIIGHSGAFASYGVTGEGLTGEGTYNNINVGYTAAVVGNAQADQSGSQTAFGDALTAIVAPGESLSGLESWAAEAINSGTGASLVGSTASILDGTYTGGEADVVSMAWRTRTADDIIANFGKALSSDVMSLTGTGNGTFVLQMNYNESLLPYAENDILPELSWLNNDGKWVNAVSGNTSGTPHFVGNVAYNNSMFALGNYGVDTGNNVVWAVINHNSEFAVPEPATIALLGLGLIVLIRRKKH